MDVNTSYRYKAINTTSYNSLAAYIATVPPTASVTATLHPGLSTIVVSGNFVADVNRFIDEENLEFHINPIAVHAENLGEVIDNETTDAATLRKIIYSMMEKKRQSDEQHEEEAKSLHSDLLKCEDDLFKCEADLLEAQRLRDSYREQWARCRAELTRVRKQVEAIAVMQQSIFPKK